MMDLNKIYWDNRYEENNTSWDVGSITMPIRGYFDQINDKSLKILIPGCGYGYEAEYLWNAGFQNLFILDISEIPLKNLKNRCPDFPDNQLLVGDFFDLSEN